MKQGKKLDGKTETRRGYAGPDRRSSEHAHKDKLGVRPAQAAGGGAKYVQGQVCNATTTHARAGATYVVAS